MANGIGSASQTSQFQSLAPNNALEIFYSTSSIYNWDRTLTQARSASNNYASGFAGLRKPDGFMNLSTAPSYCANTLQDGVWIYNFNIDTVITGIEVFTRYDCCSARVNNLTINLIAILSNLFQVFI